LENRSSRFSNDQLSIHFTRLLDYLKSSDIFGPRKLFWAKIPLPKKALQKMSLDFCLKNQSCYRRYSDVDYLPGPGFG